MQLIEAFVRNPIKVSVGVLLVCLFGVIALFAMPMQLTPEVQIPTISVTTRWPGASPHEIEREIVREQEEYLKGVEGLRKLTSESTDSSATIALEFAVGTDMNEALLKVNSRLQQVPTYPEDADEPVITASGESDRFIAWFILRPLVPTPEAIAEFQQTHPHLAEALEPARLAHNSGLRVLRLKALLEARPEAADEIAELLPPDHDMTQFQKFAQDFIEARFERVDGVSNSNVLGGREPEMQVIVDPQRLAARSLTINDLRVALRDRNKDTSGGDFWEGKRRYVVRTLGQYDDPREVEGVIVARRDGAPVYVRDVADVQLGYKKPDGVVRNFGTTAIAINCQRETGANVLDVMNGLRQANRELNEGILKQRGLQMEQVYDETDYIYSAVGLVQQNIVVGSILTVAVLLLFLRSGRSTLVIGLAIPTSIIGTFLILHALGRSLNVVSLAGMAFAVGMLVDNAVVVLENIYRHYQSGDDRMTAAVRGANEVWGAVVASTLTTLAVFIPVVFIEEEAGQLFRDIALAISSAVALSLVVSITVIPAGSARILRAAHRPARRRSRTNTVGGSLEIEGDGTNDGGRRATEDSRPPRLGLLDSAGRRFVQFIVSINAMLQRNLVLRVGTVVGFVAAAILGSYLLAPKVEYLPEGNRNLVFGILLPPPGYNLDRLSEIGDEIVEKLRPYWDVDPGSPEAAALDYPQIGDFFFVARGRQVFLGMRAEDPLEARHLVPLVQQITFGTPGTFGVAMQSSLFESGIGTGRSIDVEITGPELERLVQFGGRILGQVVQTIPESQVRPVPSLDLSAPEVHVVPLWDQAADMGLDATALGYSIDALVDGARASDYYVGGDKIDLSIIGQSRMARQTQDLDGLPIATPSGRIVPLAAVASIDLSSGPEQINHRERQRAITIQVSPPPEMPLEEAMNTIETQIVAPLRDGGELAGGYQINLAGTADKLRAAWQALRWNVALALLITYLLMAALFESWLYPLVIIFSVPLGAVGGFLGLSLLNVCLPLLGERTQPLDVLTMLGFVILIGTVVNNPILIVHQSLNLMREEGMSSRDAILASVATRIRPIFMTTATTVLGLLPLVVFPGAGSELYRGLGSVMLGGLIVSTVFTLVLVPTMFSLTLDTKASIARMLFGTTLDEIEPSIDDDDFPPASESGESRPSSAMPAR